MTSPYTPSNEKALANLRWWNVLACFLHLGQSVGAFILGMTDSTFTNFSPPLITTFAVWNQTTGPKTEIQIRAHVPFAYLTCIVPLLSAIAHGVIASSWGWPKYTENIRHLRNPWRWLEYSISSSLMIVLIAMLFCIYDISLLLALFTINATVMYTGRAMDIYNEEGLGLNRKGSTNINWKKWEPFIIGSVLASVEWAIIYMTMAQIDWSNLPLYIVPLLFIYFCLFISFAGVEFWFFYGERDFKRMLMAEKGFMILSLCAKSLLLWLIFFGMRQPGNRD